MRKAIPALPVLRIEEAVEFYQTKFGFTCSYWDNGFARCHCDHIEIHLWAATDITWQHRGISLLERPIINGAESFLAGTASCRIEVTGLDRLFEQYQRQGILHSPATVIILQPWGERDFATLDLVGNLLTFYEVVVS